MLIAYLLQHHPLHVNRLKFRVVLDASPICYMYIYHIVSCREYLVELKNIYRFSFGCPCVTIFLHPRE